MSMRRIAYSAPSGFVAETRLIDGVYVVERRALRDRRKFSARHRATNAVTVPIAVTVR